MFSFAYPKLLLLLLLVPVSWRFMPGQDMPGAGILKSLAI